MSWLGVVFLAQSEDVVIEELDEPLESDELDDSIGHLTRPEWDNTLVETGIAFFSLELGEGCGQGVGIFESWSRKLDLELEGFPRAQEDVSDNFS